MLIRKTSEKYLFDMTHNSYIQDENKEQRSAHRRRSGLTSINW